MKKVAVRVFTVTASVAALLLAGGASFGRG